MACWCGCSALKLFRDLMYCRETREDGRLGSGRRLRGRRHYPAPSPELTASLMMSKRFSSISKVAIFSTIFFRRMCCLSL